MLQCGMQRERLRPAAVSTAVRVQHAHLDSHLDSHKHAVDKSHVKPDHHTYELNRNIIRHDITDDN